MTSQFTVHTVLDRFLSSLSCPLKALIVFTIKGESTEQLEEEIPFKSSTW